MHKQLPAILKCPNCGRAGLKLASEAHEVLEGGQETVLSGAVECPECRTRYAIQEGILNFLPVKAGNIGPGQRTNHFRLTAWGYERFWRLKALSLLSGRAWPPSEELASILRQLKPAEPERLTSHNGLFFYFDQGCSTAFYGRAIARALSEGHWQTGSSAGHVVAVDNSWPMLQEARGFVERDGLSGHLSLVRADVEQLPFIDGAFAGAASGGSLNEFQHTAPALAETRRTLDAPGRAAFMVQMGAETQPGRTINRLISLTSGLHFFELKHLNELFGQAGFKVVEQQAERLVSITGLIPG